MPNPRVSPSVVRPPGERTGAPLGTVKRRAGRRLDWTAGILASLVVVSGSGCSHGTSSRLVVLVTIDTLRADHLGCYGASFAETPVLDHLATEGTLFMEAIAPAPLTLPAHTSILTGRALSAHGVLDNGLYVVPKEERTLAILFRGAGWRTGAFMGGFPLASSFGLARGFDVYDETFDRSGEESGGAPTERRAESVRAAALSWIERSGGGSVFLWVHFYDPHALYDPPAPWSSRFGSRPYDGEIAYTDHELGALLDGLARLVSPERTTVAIVGDHGEGLGEHHETTHGMFVYESTIRVPLILVAPGRIPKGRRVTEPVSTADLFPTLLEIAGVGGAPSRDQLQSVSLVGLASGAAPSRGQPVLFESYRPRLEFGWSELIGLRDGPLKFIEAPTPELYDLAADPHEERNIAPERAADLLRLRRRLGAILDSATRATLGADAASRPDEETVARLQSLGYLSAGAAPLPRRRGPLPDPKDRIDVYEREKAAGDLLSRGGGDRQRALADLREILSVDPENIGARRRLVEALLADGDGAGAEALLAGLQSEEPEYAWVPRMRSRARRALGDRPGALALLREAARREPYLARRNGVDTAVLLREMKRPMEALEETDRVLASWPDDRSALELSGDLLSDLGRLPEAETRYRRALERAPGETALLAALGRLLLRMNRGADAEPIFENLGRLDTRSTEAMRGLGIVAFLQGRYPDASRELRRARDLDPGDAETRYYLAMSLLLGGEPAAAETEARALVVAHPEAYLAHRALGIVLSRAHRYEESAGSLRRALELNPQDAVSRKELDALAAVRR